MTPYYEHDGIVIYNADCRDVDDWVFSDAMVTDPPFGMNYSSGWSDRPIANDGDTSVRDEAITKWGNDKAALVFGRWNCPRPAHTKMTLIWDKGEWPGMGDLRLPWGPSTEEIYVLGSGFVGKRCGSVIRVNRLTGNIMHPNQKPVSLLEHLILRLPDGVISDPFMGCGTTLEAAKRLGRKAIGVELEEKYCEMAAKRLSQGTMSFGEYPKSVLVEGGE